MGAVEMVNSFSVYQLLVGVPPDHAALIGTEFFRFAMKNPHQDRAANWTNTFCWRFGRVTAAKRFHAVYWQAQCGGNAFIAQPLALQIRDPLLFLIGHCGHLISEETASSQVGHGEKKN